jgi:CO/xanthine dehydrogenase FAD-binding subunit
MRSVYLPGNWTELWEYLARNPRALLYAGGTDLLLKVRTGKVDPVALICLERIEEMKGVTESADAIRLGACTTLAVLLDHPLLQKHFPVLIKALRELGSPLIRRMGTIGGNICNASPAGDTLPPLYILGAEVELKTGSTLRTLPVSGFIHGPGRAQLQPGEIMSAVVLKKQPDYNISHFEKVGLRKALACSVVSMAAVLTLSPDGIIGKARLAWGSIGPTIVTSPDVEDLLTGKKLTPEVLHAAAGIIRQELSPLDDLRAEADYRRDVAGNLLLRLADYR